MGLIAETMVKLVEWSFHHGFQGPRMGELERHGEGRQQKT